MACVHWINFLQSFFQGREDYRRIETRLDLLSDYNRLLKRIVDGMPVIF